MPPRATSASTRWVLLRIAPTASCPEAGGALLMPILVPHLDRPPLRLSGKYRQNPARAILNSRGCPRAGSPLRRTLMTSLDSRRHQMFPVLSAAQLETVKRFASGPARTFAPGEQLYAIGERHALA